MRQSRGVGAGINMTPMIDVVFQMIIFFVCTAQLEQELIDSSIQIPDAPHAPAVADAKDPRTITIELNGQGDIYIARTALSCSKLRKILKKTVMDYGARGPSIPILIRADKETQHMAVQKVLDICSEAGLYRIAFVAVKDRVD